MTDCTAIAETSVALSTAKSDPAWAYSKVVGKRNHTICIYCDKHITGGGITRLKCHLAGVTGEVDPCKSVPLEISKKMKQLIEEFKRNKERRKGEKSNISVASMFDEGDGIFALPSAETDNSRADTTVKTDPAWAHAKVVVGKRNQTICIYCNKHITGGGITRLKCHLAGVKGEVDPCKSVPLEISKKLEQSIEEFKRNKDRRKGENSDISIASMYDEDGEIFALPSTETDHSKADTTVKTDPAWSHAKVVVGKRNHTICIYCNKHIKGGGITRLKSHLAGVKGEVDPCGSVPHEVNRQMKQLIEEFKREKERKKGGNSDIISFVSMNDGDEEFVASPSAEEDRSTADARNKKRKRASNLLLPPTALEGQPPISNGTVSGPKEIVDNARMALSRWWYDANLPVEAANSPYYQSAIDAIVAAGPGFKGPSYHDLRGSLLHSNSCEIKEYLLDIKKSWKTYGCSVTSDGWSNRCPVPVINFFASSCTGTVFLKSVDTSGLTRDVDTLFALFDDVVQLAEPSNIVQLITDSEDVYKAAGERLASKYRCFSWSPCAAHCLDMILESLANSQSFPHIAITIENAKHVARYVYNNAWVLNTMRTNFTNGRDLCRPGISRYATNFLTLQCFLKFKNELRQMFTSDKWLKSSYGKSPGGKSIEKIIVEDGMFWANCQLAVKVSEPLVRVLRFVDGGGKQAMGYLYDAMEKSKESIKSRLKNRSSLYAPYAAVIDAGWENQLLSPLHAAGCLLNPRIFFRNGFEKEREVTRGFIMALVSLVTDDVTQEAISTQLEKYKKSMGDFGLPLAIRQREKLNPVSWWEQFGNECPELKNFAVRVLSQSCSSSRFERNWGTFEFIHCKKQNRIEHKRLLDVVFVRYNLKLRARNSSQRKDVGDPISLDNIDLLEDWVSEEPSLLPKEDLEDDPGWETLESPFEALELDDSDPCFDDDDDDAGLYNPLNYNECPDQYNYVQ